MVAEDCLGLPGLASMEHHADSKSIGSDGSDTHDHPARRDFHRPSLTRGVRLCDLSYCGNFSDELPASSARWSRRPLPMLNGYPARLIVPGTYLSSAYGPSK